MTRSTQARPSWLSTCPRCGRQVIASDWHYPLADVIRAPRHVDPIALDQAGQITAILLARETIRVHRDPAGRIHLTHTYNTPRDDQPNRNRNRAHHSWWAIPAGHVDLGTAPHHHCGSTLPGTPITIHADDHCRHTPDCHCLPPF